MLFRRESAMIQKKEAWLWTSGFCGIFLAVAQQESITKAAEVLHITQPTLSRQIAQAEE